MSRRPESLIPDDMSETPHIESRVSVLEQGMRDMSRNVNEFMIAQKEENSKFYSALNAVTDKLMLAIDNVKTVVSARGQVTGTFVLTLIATVLSLIAIIGGGVHFYVSSQVSSSRIELLQVRDQLIQVRNENAATLADQANKAASLAMQVNEERIRSMRIDTQGDVERTALKEAVAKMQNERTQEMQEELKRLRAKLP